MLKGYFANICMFLGMLALLSTVFVYASGLPSGEMAYQRLWIGRMSWVFLGCCFLSFCLGGKKKPYLGAAVVQALILCGGIEAVWGLRQLYGWSVSHHSMYALTGSFYNPGPYSGYLAMVFPLCLYEWLVLRKKEKKTLLEQIRYYVARSVFLMILCLLPAGMSRSAWLAALVSGLWIGGMHYSWGAFLKRLWQQHTKKVVAGSLAGVALSVVLIAFFFHIKANSANGRLLMWKISCLAVAEKPWTGYSTDSFVRAYGDAQEKYFAETNYLPKEEWVAGSPDYAFNEYLQVAVEYGVPFLVSVLFLIAFALWKGVTQGRIAACGGLISVLVFAFSSYPMQIPSFALAFFCLLAACIIKRSWVGVFIFAFLMFLLGDHYRRENRYDECRKWASSQMLYKIGAYKQAQKEYEKLYPALKDRGAFLFEYGHCLHKLEDYPTSTTILKEAATRSCDPMILNIIAKNYQALKEYEEAEKWLVRSTHRLPGRIYPYYLLAKLYAEPEFYKPDKLKQMVQIVLTKEPKVQSTAIREMREEVKKLQ